MNANDINALVEAGSSSSRSERAPPPAYKPADKIISAAEVDNCEAIEKEKVKTVLCVYYMHGKRCKYGTHCAFAHGEDELRAPPPEMLEKKRELTEKQALKQKQLEEERREKERKNPPPPYVEKAAAKPNSSKKYTNSYNRRDDRREPPSYETFREGGRGRGGRGGGGRGSRRDW
ncbi:hypothetical protein AGDE_14329 [Angomonas deanei]|uniref:Zinc finger C-x8-C-x5-C-x3-H type (And similar), putative n=1 Tax=Angomonas deanei TaxID=59799 RepID=A0A7G2CDZ0_9TRYP|nr:hypothetical protein AGDE_14329 [Angomonas deanei]CAD2218060.1 Zinc finger C-x8-C-x5-C-x3-H type (and similar), putative [Angomonas deanei]|eukprot:EPY21031.1 hypothetical protein AGDE_14329 [Angomonas deanei]